MKKSVLMIGFVFLMVIGVGGVFAYMSTETDTCGNGICDSWENDKIVCSEKIIAGEHRNICSLYSSGDYSGPCYIDCGNIYSGEEKNVTQICGDNICDESEKGRWDISDDLIKGVVIDRLACIDCGEIAIKSGLEPKSLILPFKMGKLDSIRVLTHMDSGDCYQSMQASDGIIRSGICIDEVYPTHVVLSNKKIKTPYEEYKIKLDNGELKVNDIELELEWRKEIKYNEVYNYKNREKKLGEGRDEYIIPTYNTIYIISKYSFWEKILNFFGIF